MKKQNLTLSGFSLVELMVVVAIIAIMSVSVSVGFRYMGDTLRAKQAAGIITDTVKKAEMEVLRGDYRKNTLKFMADYLVITSEPKETNLNLEWNETNLTATSSGSLSKKDADGKTLGMGYMNVGDTEPVAFGGSAETEWQYQLVSGDKVSPVIRFVHFNIERDKPENAVKISVETDNQLTIESPYAKKTGTPITLKVSDIDGNHEETIIIQ